MTENDLPRWVVLRGHPDHDGSIRRVSGNNFTTTAEDAWYHESQFKSQPFKPLDLERPIRRVQPRRFDATEDFESIGRRKFQVFKFTGESPG